MDLTPPSTSAELLQGLGTALGLGLIVGLQREWAGKEVAGIRTCALVCLLGALCGLLGGIYGGWIVAAGFLGCAATLVCGGLGLRRKGDVGAGTTTEIAVLLVFLIGVICVLGEKLIAAVCAGTLMVLLQSKAPLHRLVQRIGENELREIARLVLIGLVILPLLPNRDMGYLDVFNPFEVWLLVVLIVAISLFAYLAGKFLSGSKGAVVAGLLGGLISSTATTVSASRRSSEREGAALPLAVIIIIASAVVFLRVIIEVCLTAPGHLKALLPPLITILVWSSLVAAFLWWRSSRGKIRDPGDEDVPSEFKTAVTFALMYVAVLYGIAFAKENLGDSGLYAVAAISGLTDMDAITLSTSQLVSRGHVDADTGWRVILLGGLANLVFKSALVVILGSRPIYKPVLLAFGAIAAGGTLLLVLWP